MWYFFPGMWRALYKTGREYSLRKTGKIDVYVLQHRLETGGQIYFLFLRPLPACTLGPMVSDLSTRTYLVGGSIDLQPHSVTIRWRRTEDVWEPDDYLVGDIRLTVFEHLLGTLEPHHVCWNIWSSDVKRTVGRVASRHGVNWAEELGLRRS